MCVSLLWKRSIQYPDADQIVNVTLMGVLHFTSGLKVRVMAICRLSTAVVVRHRKVGVCQIAFFSQSPMDVGTTAVLYLIEIEQPFWEYQTYPLSMCVLITMMCHISAQTVLLDAFCKIMISLMLPLSLPQFRKFQMYLWNFTGRGTSPPALASLLVQPSR